MAKIPPGSLPALTADHFTGILNDIPSEALFKGCIARNARW